MRKYHLDKYDGWAGCIVAFGTLLRMVMIGLGWPAPYNDEGTIGLMALHVAYKGAHPLLYYGQDYMGSLEAYLAAGFFRLFEPSTFTLRLSLVILFALFLLCMYRLTTLLYSKSLGLITLLVLSLGSADVVLRQLMAAGGTPEYFFFTALLLLLTTWLLFTSEGNKDTHEPVEKRHISRSRLLSYAAWGAIAGLDMWSHLLSIPFVLGTGLLLFIFCRKELRFPVLLLPILTLLLGVSPFFIYQVTVPVSTQEISLLTGAFGGGYREPSYPAPQGMHSGAPAMVAPKPIPPVPGLQVLGTILVSIPVATNGITLCPIEQKAAWPLTNQSSTSTRACSVVHGLWGIGFLALWSIAALSAFGYLRRLHKSSRALSEDADKVTLPNASTKIENPAEQRQETMRQAMRLTILLSAGSTILLFMLYPQAAAVTPWISARYLIGLLIATPGVLFPLWEKSMQLKTMPSWLTYARVEIVKKGLLLLIFVVSLLATLTIFTQELPIAQAGFQQQQALIDSLLSKGATHIYADYEDCDRTVFLSNERIICASVDKGLRPGLDRYFPYRAMVAQAPHPFYVLQDHSVQAFLFEQKAKQQHIVYKKFRVSGYSIYEPEQRILV